MNFINPTPEQFKKLMAMDDEGPIVMLNMLKYKPDGGRELYAKYEACAGKILSEKIGGRLLQRGDFMMTVIGEEDWDDVFLVEYPSIAAFIELQRDKEYQAAVPNRTEALIDSRLYMLARVS